MTLFYELSPPTASFLQEPSIFSVWGTNTWPPTDLALSTDERVVSLKAFSYIGKLVDGDIVWNCKNVQNNLIE